MKTGHLLSSFILGTGLALALLWVLGGGNVPAMAAPPAVSALCAAEGPIEAPDIPAAELHVCATCTHTTVQSAVDAAIPGDIIKVATGVYTGVQVRNGVFQVVYISKTVTIQGGYTTTNWTTPHPITQPTTLDAEGQGRVLYIAGAPSALDGTSASGQAISPTIEGLHITGGNAGGLGGGSGGWDAGGGLYVEEATATISDNRVVSNTAYGGGGLYLHYSDATLHANTISGNTANGAHAGGGGLYLFDSAAILSGNVISSNVTDDEGGGLYLFDSDATLSDNIIGSNTASDDGGGLYLHYSDATLSGNTIISNTAYSGGGLFQRVSNSTFSGNTIVANSAQLGGGLSVRESSARLDNNIVADNRAAHQGSGLYVEGSSLRLRHTTVAHNTGGDGSGIYVTDYGPYYSTVALTNTILVSHTVGIIVKADNVASLEATLWGDGAWANIADWSGAGTILTGTVNVYGVPAFVGVDDYHITTDSAARDAGVDAGVNPDIDWDLRPIGAGFDIGADEFPVVITTSQGVSATLVYTDRRGNPTTLKVPAGAVIGTVTIVYTPKDPRTALPLPEGMALGPHIFDLDVYRNGALVPDFIFERAVTLTSEYSNADVFGIDEDTLALYRRTGGEWAKIGTRQGETYTLDIENNLLTSYLLGTSQFGEYGDAIPLRFVWLPLLIRNG